jgi:hypothetical protein
MADGTLKVGTITTSSGSGTITIPNTVTVAGAMANTPAFEAYLSSDQTISDDTWTKVNIDSEVYDTNPSFASNKFTPGVAGKYFIYASVLIETTGGHEYNLGQTGLYKNGSLFRTNRLDPESASVIAANVPIQAVVTANDTDYFELYAYMDRTSGGTINIKTSTQSTYFGAYRIIGA